MELVGFMAFRLLLGLKVKQGKVWGGAKQIKPFPS